MKIGNVANSFKTHEVQPRCKLLRSYDALLKLVMKCVHS